MADITVLVAASGSGGHLLPARYIAESLRTKIQASGKLAAIEFVGSGRPLEQKLIADFGYPLHTVAVHGIAGRGLSGFFEALVEYPAAAFKVLRLLRQLRPDVIVGVGGYVSVLPVLLGRLLKIPCLIHEAEFHPGLATKILSLFSNKITTAFADARIFAKQKLVHTGHPLRSDFGQVSYNSGPRKNLLVIGGSQGSKTLDLLVSKVVAEFPSENLQVKHQGRSENLTATAELYRQKNKQAEVVTFFEDMIAAYSWADIIISRAGAGSVKEIELLGKPAILIPLPGVGGHQRENAFSIADGERVLVVEEGVLFENHFKAALSQLLASQSQNVSAQSPGFGVEYPQDKIAAEILKLLRPKLTAALSN